MAAAESNVASVENGKQGQPAPPCRERWAAWLVRPSVMGPVQAWVSVVRLRPAILVMPLLFLALAVALGVWGVVRAADSQATGDKVATHAFGESVARSLTSAVSTLYMPLQALTASVVAAPHWDTVGDRFLPFAKAILASSNAPGTRVGLWPQATNIGYSALAWPIGIRNYDLFQGPTQELRDSFLQFLAARVVGGVWQIGPILFNGTVFTSAFAPVFIANAAESETFGIPGYNGTVKCSVCYNATSRTKFWGLSFATIPLSAVFNEAQRALESRGYCYSLINPKQVPGSSQLTLMSEIFSSDVPPSKDVSVTLALDASDTQWVLTLSPEGGYSPTWETPLIAVVVIVSIALAVLLHLLLLSRYKHRLLLEAILPPKVIDRMHNGIGAYLNNIGQHTTSGSPADKILSVTEELLEGKQPALQDVVLIRTAIKESANIYNPMDLSSNIKAALDDDVAQSLLQQLQMQHRDLSKISPERGDDLRDAAICEPEEDLRFLDVQQGMVALLELGRPDTLGADSAGHTAATHFVSSADGVSQLHPSSVSIVVAPTCKDEEAADRGSKHSLDVKHGTSVDGSQSGRTSNPGHRFSRRAVVPADDGSPDNSVRAPLTSSKKADAGNNCALPVEASQAIPRFLIDEVEAVLAGSWEWQFDVFKLNDVTGGRPLSALGFYAMHHTGLVHQFNINSAKLARFLCAAEAQYNANPYHNAAHAAGVLHTMHVMMHRGGLAPSYADPLTHMACLLAAIVHDLDHTGRTNDFLVSTNDDLALRYNDKAPQENHHLASAFLLLKKPDLNFLSNISTKERTELRRLVIELVLATDMKVHFQLVSHFGMLNRLGESTLYGEPGASRFRPSGDPQANAKPVDNRGEGLKTIHEQHAPKTSTMGSVGPKTSTMGSVGPQRLAAPPAAQRFTSGGGAARGTPVKAAPQHEAKQRKCTDETERLLGLQIALKCSDLAHTAAPLHVHRRWVSALEEEFFLQGDAEREANLPISPLFDRQKHGVNKSQPGFYEFVVIPLYSSFVQAFPDMEPLHSSMMSNYQYWLAERTRGTSTAGTAKATS